MAKYAVKFSISVDVEDLVDVTLIPLETRESFKQQIADKAKSTLFLKYHEPDGPELIQNLVIDDVWKFDG